MARYEYKCSECEEIEVFDRHPKAHIPECIECNGELRLHSVDSSYQWECSECGAPVDRMNEVCSNNCFKAMMR